MASRHGTASAWCSIRLIPEVMMTAWDERTAAGLAAEASLFDEAIERRWSNQWLFYGNSTRFASAMGGADYGVFANGRYVMSAKLRDLADWLGFLRAGGEAAGGGAE